MRAVAEVLADPTVRTVYMAFCFAVMVLPMLGLSLWYHRGISATPGGRELMRRQNASRSRPPIGTARILARDIASGRYGAQARDMQTRVYWVVGLWVLANVLAFGLLIYADEIHRAVG